MAVRGEPIPLWDGDAPGSEAWDREERAWTMPPPPTWSESEDLTMLCNVVRPTITPVLPEIAAASGTGVLVCPGGGYFMLAIARRRLRDRALARRSRCGGVRAHIPRARDARQRRRVDGHARGRRRRRVRWRERRCPRRCGAWTSSRRFRSPTPSPRCDSSATGRASGVSAATVSARSASRLVLA